MGDYYVPLQRAVNITDKDGDIVNRMCGEPHYVPVNTSKFDTIEMLIKNDIGENTSFFFKGETRTRTNGNGLRMGANFEFRDRSGTFGDTPILHVERIPDYGQAKLKVKRSMIRALARLEPLTPCTTGRRLTK